jgi:Uma2 family endonuclease
MAAAPQKRMTSDEFLDWIQHQEEKYELVDGIPVKKFRPRRGAPTTGMAGGTVRHRSIAANIRGHLYAKLKGGPCHPHASNLAVRTAIDQTRFPEVTVDCGPRVSELKEAIAPIAVFEVLSPTTRGIDTQIKLVEYRRHQCIRTIVVVEPEDVDILVYARDDAGEWQMTRFRDRADAFDVVGTSARLSLDEIYEGIKPPDPDAAP